MLSLGDIERAPERIGELSPADAARLIGQLAVLHGALLTRALSNSHDDHLISFDEAADLLRCEKTWIYRRSKRLPFVVQDGGLKRVSYSKLQDYMRTHANAENGR